MSRHILHAQISGKGKPIVLLHGYLSSSQYFKHIRGTLETNHTVVALDLLGFGRSPKPKVGYTYNDHIAAIKATLDQLGIQTPFVLLGHSMGALIALKYAVIHGSDIAKLLLFNPPLFTDRSQMTEVHKATARRYRVMLYSKGRHVYWLTLRLIPKRHAKRRPAINFTDIISMSPAAREGSYHNVIGGATVFEDFKKLTVPTLLVNGAYDRAVYLKNLEQNPLPSHITIMNLETGHHPLVRNTKQALAIIESYLTN